MKFCGVHIPSQIHRLLDRTTAPQLRLTCASGPESGAWKEWPRGRRLAPGGFPAAVLRLWYLDSLAPSSLVALPTEPSQKLAARSQPLPSYGSSKLHYSFQNSLLAAVAAAALCLIVYITQQPPTTTTHPPLSLHHYVHYKV